ncbi:hypothetical protein [Rhodococcus globerulus]|uniref:Restriction endonuclease AspBHI N-terminal domain-containing protein n=1 Tax=Rhodococcus globerulus TaxID=33008 RepID=A0ABU4C5U6_RHOGO|nr:hypothetical protein [Rhodococcus globerulus]MDV6271568.1 hypothetical protein [Rhodococcus globerulus]
MPTDNRTIPFEDLADADLYVGAVYLGGRQGAAADDPLAKLLPVGNQGGFRHTGSPTKGTVRLSVLDTSSAEAEWPDALDPGTGSDVVELRTLAMSGCGVQRGPRTCPTATAPSAKFARAVASRERAHGWSAIRRAPCRC